MINRRHYWLRLFRWLRRVKERNENEHDKKSLTGHLDIGSHINAARSAAAGSGSAADAGGSRAAGCVRLGRPPLAADTVVVLPDARSTTPLSSSAPAYWITSSARRSRGGGMVIPSALAVLRLMISSNFVGCSTGKSAGLTPFRILSTYVAARWNISDKFTP